MHVTDLARFHSNLEDGVRASRLSSPSTYLMRGFAARRLFRVSSCRRALYIYKYPCLLQDSNLGPTAQRR
ncbi:hypothetical protein TNCV_3785531 [Trichonephila clavipes]|nr:hypothetical protein TNCV_3785531 [Trichonephila clavipes]